MSRYAVKIGEVYLTSQEPITSEYQTEIVEYMRTCLHEMTDGGLITLEIPAVKDANSS